MYLSARDTKVWLALLLVLLLSGCHETLEEPTVEPTVASRTLVVFMPWSTNMKEFFDENVAGIEQAMAQRDLRDERVVVCIATSTTHAALVELRHEGGMSHRDTLRHIAQPDFTTEAAIAQLLTDIKGIAPAHRYAMIVGGHGMAWIPKAEWKRSAYSRVRHGARPLTRWIGGLAPMYQIDIETLAEGIRLSGTTLDYLLFDDCHMSSVEVAYALRHVARYIVACPTEVMAFGFPYHLCGQYLFGEPDFERLCATFHDFYSHYSVPCGTVAVTDCAQLDHLAAVVRSIHASTAPTAYDSSEVQPMDGYTPPLFLDLEDTYRHCGADSTLLAALHEQLGRTVVAKACTNYYFSAASSALYSIRSFSGLTTSEASTNATAAAKTTTQWYRATH